MGVWKFEVLDVNGAKETVLDFSLITFTEKLNGIGSFKIVVSKSSSYSFDKYLEYQKSNGSGNEQGLFYATNPNGYLEFKGKVDKINKDGKGNLVISGTSTLDFAQRISVSASDRSSEANTARSTYLSGLVSAQYSLAEGSVTSFSGNDLGAVYYGYNNVYQVLKQMVVAECDQDFFMTYNSTIGGNDSWEIRNDAGSNTSIKTFVDSEDVRNVVVETDSRNIINSVKVIGAVVSGSQVSTTVSDSTSISTYGKREPSYPFVNKTIEDSATAKDVGDQIIANLKDPKNFYGFEVLNSGLNAEDPDTSPRSSGCFALGDQLDLTSSSANLSDNSVRLMSYTRVFYPDKTHFLSFGCINSGLRFDSDPFDTTSQNRDGADIDGSTGDSTTGAGITNVQTTSNSGVTDNAFIPFGSVVGTGRCYGTVDSSIGSFTNVTDDEDYTIGGDQDDSNEALDTSGTVTSTSGITLFLFNIESTSGVGTDIDVRLYVLGAGNYYPDSGGVTVRNHYGSTQLVSVLIAINEDLNSRDVQVQMKGTIGDWDVTWVAFGKPTASTTYNDANHTNPNTFDDANHSNDSGTLYAKGSAD